MAKWVLRCKNCDQVFTHSEISNTLANYFIAEKPEFSPSGTECECPHCKSKFTYKQNELRYKDR
jgi:uncharacterized C2H2 Zn-finger protein